MKYDKIRMGGVLQGTGSSESGYLIARLAFTRRPDAWTWRYGPHLLIDVQSFDSSLDRLLMNGWPISGRCHQQQNRLGCSSWVLPTPAEDAAARPESGSSLRPRRHEEQPFGAATEASVCPRRQFAGWLAALTLRLDVSSADLWGAGARVLLGC